MPHPFPNLPPDRRGRVERLWVHAPCLADNPWGDPAEREVLVVVPRGAGPDTPAVLVLAGFAGTGEDALGRSLLDPSLPSRIDALIDAGCPPFYAVLPDAMTTLGGSQFLDSPAIGAYQTWLVDAVMPAVEAAFPTSGRWGATGRSSGAFGAFHLALRAPDRVRAVAWHAGDCAFDLCYLADIPAAIRGVQAAGGVVPFLRGFWDRRKLGGDDFAALNVIAMACAYATAPLVDRDPTPLLPFDPLTGAVRFDVLQGWAAFDPIHLVARHAATLRGLDLLWMDVGDRDEYLLHLGARRLAAALSAHGVPHTYEEFAGGHRGTAWRYERSLPELARALRDGRDRA